MKLLERSDHEVERKLVEELIEYEEVASNEETIEELADLLELIYAVLPLHESSMD